MENDWGKVYYTIHDPLNTENPETFVRNASFVVSLNFDFIFGIFLNVTSIFTIFSISLFLID